MRYSRRRIQRVSGVTIRDERIESRDFSVAAVRESWDKIEDDGRDRMLSRRESPLDRVGAAHRERT